MKEKDIKPGIMLEFDPTKTEESRSDYKFWSEECDSRWWIIPIEPIYRTKKIVGWRCLNLKKNTVEPFSNRTLTLQYKIQ